MAKATGKKRTTLPKGGSSMPGSPMPSGGSSTQNRPAIGRGSMPTGKTGSK